MAYSILFTSFESWLLAEVETEIGKGRQTRPPLRVACSILLTSFENWLLVEVV